MQQLRYVNFEHYMHAFSNKDCMLVKNADA